MQTYKFDPEKSKIKWQGEKVNGDKHFGLVNLKEGEITINADGFVSGGYVLIDMKSLRDQSLDDPEASAKLEKHLKSKDFFDVETYPEAHFRIVDSHQQNDTDFEVVGHLRIKEKSHSNAYILKVQKIGDDQVSVKADIAFDRTKWGVNFHSVKFFDDLKDKAINDLVKLELDLSS